LFLLLLAANCQPLSPHQQEIPTVPPASVAGDGQSAMVNSAGRAAGNRQATPHIIVLVFDSMRASALGAYGEPRPVSPSLDKFARESLQFINVHAHASYTSASSASLFTGTLPDQHRVLAHTDRLPQDIPVLASALKSVGYCTVAVSEMASCSRHQGFDAGFDQFEHGFGQGIGPEQRAMDKAAYNALQQFIIGAAHRPQFLYLHFRRPHGPYDGRYEYQQFFRRHPELADTQADNDELNRLDAAGPLAPELVEHLRDLYDAGARTMDDTAGWVIRVLEQASVLDATVVIAMADHGEAFYEHRRLVHSHSIYGELTNIPLLIRAPVPDAQRGLWPGLAATGDIYETILAAAGIARSAHQTNGNRPLWPAVRGEHVEPREWLYTRAAGDFPPQHRGIRSARWFFAIRAPGQTVELFDVEADPAERRNLAQEEPERAEWFHTELLREERSFRAFQSGANSPGTAGRAPDPELMDQLEKLGYLH